MKNFMKTIRSRVQKQGDRICLQSDLPEFQFKDNNKHSAWIRRKLGLLALGSLLMVCGCSDAKEPEIQIPPTNFSMYGIDSKAETDEREDDLIDFRPGKYTFENPESIDGESTAIFQLYISDKQYENMNQQLSKDLKASLNPGQSCKLTLNDGEYLYICAKGEDENQEIDSFQNQLNVWKD
ncbi:hypothetical protein [Ileibacterium valens]|uniref:hypothetical protein n=2 Tax=Ileibacterium valens TaxID=1862668 RepID=UPI0011785338|nr:hypothetical protein [Ileibacterium valens]